VQNRPINDHDYDSVTQSCICRKYAEKYAVYARYIYMPHISPNSAYFPPKSSAYFKKILSYKPPSLIMVQHYM